MNKIRYINLCIVKFGEKHKMRPPIAFNYLRDYKGLDFLDKHYEAEHLLSLDDALNDLQKICRRNGGTL